MQLSMKVPLTASTPGEAQPQISYRAIGKKESHMSRKPAAKPQPGHKPLMREERCRRIENYPAEAPHMHVQHSIKALLHFDVESSLEDCGLRLV